MDLGSFTTRYALAASFWDHGDGLVRIQDIHRQILLTFSLTFLRQGKVNTFSFILQQITACYDCSTGQILDSNMNTVDSDGPVTEGTFTFNGEVSGPALGPRFKYKLRAPVVSGDDSTMSNSRRSSTNQSHFREALCARDSSCLVSGAHYSRCTACHIIPQSRPEVGYCISREYYTEILGYDPGYLFMASFGLLLADDLHHAFDRGELAFWPLGENLIVHMFNPSDIDWKSYHGKVISPSRFHTTLSEQPDRRLLHFHYRQCAMMRLRGFWCPTQ